jgi:hypothetical protein
MISDFDAAPREISEVTRRAVIDHFGTANVNWAGRLEDDEFLARIYDHPSLPSLDHRYKDAADDIFHHCRFNDWARDWIFLRSPLQSDGCGRLGISPVSLRDRAPGRPIR